MRKILIILSFILFSCYNNYDIIQSVDETIFLVNGESKFGYVINTEFKCPTHYSSEVYCYYNEIDSILKLELEKAYFIQKKLIND